MLKAAARILAPGSPFGYNLPDKNWFKYAQEETRYTPDIAVLEQHAWQLYFACDETQQGHLKSSLLGEEVEYKMPGYTQQSFNYWSHQAPFIPPIPLEATGYHNVMPNYPEIAKIKGQVLLIRPKAFLDLDNYKENGVQYLRKKVRLLIPYRKLRHLNDHDLPTDDIEFEMGDLGLTFESLCVIRAWMYVGIPQYWDKLISAYDYTSVQTYQSKNRKWCHTYYQLRRPARTG